MRQKYNFLFKTAKKSYESDESDGSDGSDGSNGNNGKLSEDLELSESLGSYG